MSFSLETPLPMTPEAFGFICALVKQEASLVIEAGKEYLIEARLNFLLREYGMNRYDDLVEKLRSESTPFSFRKKIVEALTTNETYFFRDHHPFEVLREKILPKLIATRRPQQELNIWSAACSTGQEAYSTAILLREHFPELASWKVKIVATDLNQIVVERAQKGRYNQIEINRGLPAALLLKYFQKDGSDWVLAEGIRRMVEFSSHNLMHSWNHLPSCDIIFMRNVMIYFDVATKQKLLAQVHRQLRPDGHLLLGGAETTVNLSNLFLPKYHDKTVVFSPI